MVMDNIRSIYVVGDIHGCYDKLRDLLINIDKHRELYPNERATLVFVGDYVDRGPDSKRVLETVYDMTINTPANFENVVALKGNHELMMIQANDSRHDQGMWAMNGGIQTLNSFGYNPVIHDTIVDIIGAKLYRWIRELPEYYTTGLVAVAHAGIDDPHRQAGEHTDDELLWSRLLRMEAHNYYKYTVHGHTPMKEPLVDEHVAYIDTGAVFGRQLSCLYIQDVVNITKKEIITNAQTY